MITPVAEEQINTTTNKCRGNLMKATIMKNERSRNRVQEAILEVNGSNLSQNMAIAVNNELRSSVAIMKLLPEDQENT